MSGEKLACGKLPHQLLEKLLKIIEERKDDKLIIGPGIGVDSAVVSWDGKLLVVTSDPITFTSDLIGWYTVMVNANDIAVMGASPRYLLVTLLLPMNCSSELPLKIMQQIEEACRKLSITVIGGHTEIAPGLERPISIGTMLGETDRVIRPLAQEGDLICLTKGIAIEGTAILAREFPDLLISLGIEKDVLDRAKNFINEPGISVVEEALAIRDLVTSMHDPTEGGLATAIYEFSISNDKGALIYEDSIPILPECKLICEKLGLNPLGLIASGALLFTISADKVEMAKYELEKKGIKCWAIGEVKSKDFGLKLMRNGSLIPLPYFERDELARLEEEWAE
ncbi:hydrogenase expression protein [bacterium]|nr:hydrogenase expression protein [bacterium]